MSERALKLVEMGGVWTVQLGQGGGTHFEYRYHSEEQARFMAAVFEMGPPRLPVPDAIWTLPRFEGQGHLARAA